MSAESFNLHMAQAVNTDRHLRTMLNGYLQKSKRFNAPLTRSEDLAMGVGEEDTGLRLCGYFNGFPAVTGSKNQEEALYFLTKWWRNGVKDRKVKAHHLIFNVREDFTREALRNGIHMADHLPLMVDSTLAKYRDTFYRDENLAYVSEVHRDQEHPHCHCLIFPYTDSGTRLSFSSSYKFPGREDGLTRNMRAATKRMYQSEGERISFLAHLGQEDPRPDLREQRNVFIRTAMTLSCPVVEGKIEYRKTDDILPEVDEAIYEKQAVDDEENNRAMLERMSTFTDENSESLQKFFHGIVKYLDSYPKKLISLRSIKSELDIASAPSKEGSHSQRYRAILERRGAIAQLGKDLKDRREQKRSWDRSLALFLALGDEKTCAAIGEKPYHARVVKGPAKLLPSFNEFHSHALIDGHWTEFLDKKAAILATMETPDNKSSANQNVAPPIFPDTTDWNFSEAKRIALLSPNAPFHGSKKGPSHSRFPNFPEPDPIAFFLGIQRD